MIWSIRLGCFCVLLIAISATSPALAKSTKEVEEEVAALSRAMEAQSKNLATAMNQIQEVLAEFQKMHGQVDQNNFVGDRLEKMILDSQRRIDVLEDKQQLLVEQLEEIKAAGLLSTDQGAKLKVFNDYQVHLGKINREDYKGAITGLNTFITSNPRSHLAAYAQYWVGESYFALRDFPASVTACQQLIKKYPESTKVPGCLLKQGLSFYETQSFAEAKAFLAKLVSRYPKSIEAERARDKIQAIDQLEEQRKLEQLGQTPL